VSLLGLVLSFIYLVGHVRFFFCTLLFSLFSLAVTLQIVTTSVLQIDFLTQSYFPHPSSLLATDTNHPLNLSSNSRIHILPFTDVVTGVKLSIQFFITCHLACMLSDSMNKYQFSLRQTDHHPFALPLDTSNTQQCTS